MPSLHDPSQLIAAGSPWLPEMEAAEPLSLNDQQLWLPDTDTSGSRSLSRELSASIDSRPNHSPRPQLIPSSDADTSNASHEPTKLKSDTHPSTLASSSSFPPSPSPSGPDEIAPPPPRKDTPPPLITPARDSIFSGLGSYFSPTRNRPGSIYTLSRASFANQLAQLTSLQLPDAASLSGKISAIATSQVATQALINAAAQILSWIAKADEVISGLDSEDDVEWAAAGGREGLDDVEDATSRFENLINAYITAVEELQRRPDIATVSSNDLRRAIAQMDSVVEAWATIRSKLRAVRSQVEMAMEWEELWNSVLGDIQAEMDHLSRLVFEMEERRHRGAAVSVPDAPNLTDLSDLDSLGPRPSMAAHAAAPRPRAASRPSQAPARPASPTSPGTSTMSREDSNLLALFARLQPLRASLDFLPMRLSVFETRAHGPFPTACEELEMRRAGLEASYSRLELDTDSLRKELGEDRWVAVFRGAGRQAHRMYDSVRRSLRKLGEALDADLHLTDSASMALRLESYEAKKTHYGPAIERVLSIIGKGVMDRLTVNGEILRLHSDLQSRWDALKDQIRDMDALIERLQVEGKSQKLRDSVSSMLSNDRSTLGSGGDTSGSSPPSSAMTSNLGWFDPHTPAPKKLDRGRSPGAAGNWFTNGGGGGKASARGSSVTTPASSATKPSPRAGPASHPIKKTGSWLSAITGSTPGTPPTSSKLSRPRFGLGKDSQAAGLGRHGADSPSPASTSSRAAPRSVSETSRQRSGSSLGPLSAGGSRLPMLRKPLPGPSSTSPKTETPARTGPSRLAFRDRLASPGPRAHPLPPPKAATPGPPLTNRRSSLRPSVSETTVHHGQPSCPATPLSVGNRRSSLLPHPRGDGDESRGRASPHPTSANRTPSRFGLGRTVFSDAREPPKPRWRF